MDIELFFAVLRRFWKLVLGGLLLAIVLAAVAHMHRSETWQSSAEALITSASAADGQGGATSPADAATNPVAAAAGNPVALSGFAPVYVQFANANAVQDRLRDIPGKVVAGEVTDPSDGAALPFVALSAVAPTASDAVKLNHEAFTVLQQYITQQQISSGVGARNRTTLQLIQNGDPPVMTGGSSTTISLLVFVAIFGGAIAIAFMLENSRPKTAAKLGRVPDAGSSPNGAPVRVKHVVRANGARAVGEPLRSQAEDRAPTTGPAMHRDPLGHGVDDDDESQAWLDGLMTSSPESSRSG
ncbi:MAG TPA: hypothetical protein VN880_10605 [Solirubrobacteraceae bacterium]|nr:hypothetical protein [Solirubrobacteraceae bacterium]